MTAVSEYRTQIEEIRKRLNGTNGHNGDRIVELKERLSTVRTSLLRKQEIIDAQTREIAGLRDENGQLSEMLGQALAALDEQSKDGLQEIVQSFDSEFSGLLSDEGAEAVVTVSAEVGNPEPEAGNPEPEAEAETKEAGAQKPRSDDAGPEPELENESPALRRIMGRRRR